MWQSDWGFGLRKSSLGREELTGEQDKGTSARITPGVAYFTKSEFKIPEDSNSVEINSMQ